MALDLRTYAAPLLVSGTSGAVLSLGARVEYGALAAAGTRAAAASSTRGCGEARARHGAAVRHVARSRSSSWRHRGTRRSDPSRLTARPCRCCPPPAAPDLQGPDALRRRYGKVRSFPLRTCFQRLPLVLKCAVPVSNEQTSAAAPLLPFAGSTRPVNHTPCTGLRRPLLLTRAAPRAAALMTAAALDYKPAHSSTHTPAGPHTQHTIITGRRCVPARRRRRRLRRRRQLCAVKERRSLGRQQPRQGRGQRHDQGVCVLCVWLCVLCFVLACAKELIDTAVSSPAQPSPLLASTNPRPLTVSHLFK